MQQWRLSFLAKAGRDARKARAARISANSIIRQARSLFAPKVVKFLKTLGLPQPLPFAGVEFFPRESMRYTSRIDAGILMRQAREELAKSCPDAFLVMVLALGAGLRRGEIDKLLWRDVDFSGGRIFITESEHGELKTEDSRGAVDIDQSTKSAAKGNRVKYAKTNTVNTQRFIAQYGKAARYPLCQAALTILREEDGEFSALTKDVALSEERVNSVKQLKEEAQAAIDHFNKQRKEKEANLCAALLRKIDELLPKAQSWYQVTVEALSGYRQIRRMAAAQFRREYAAVIRTRNVKALEALRRVIKRWNKKTLPGDTDRRTLEILKMLREKASVHRRDLL